MWAEGGRNVFVDVIFESERLVFILQQLILSMFVCGMGILW